MALGTGAYVIQSDSMFEPFQYPGGLSRVYYIGKAPPPGHRLVDHRENTKDWDHRYSVLMEEYKDHRFVEPVYNYAQRFEAWITWFRTVEGTTPESLERELMTAFWDQHGAYPAAVRRFERQKNDIDR